jgi:ABC-type transport system involved in multi-copper enzyme maturation permease subunit
MALSFLIISENINSSADGSHISGMDAIQANKASQAIPEGKLTKQKLLEAFHQYQTVMNNPSNYEGTTDDLKNEVYVTELQPYDSVLSLLRRNYSPTGRYDYYILSSVSDEMINRFYEMRHAKIQEIVNMDYSYGNYSPTQKEFISNKDSKIETPFSYDYTDGWSDILQRGFFTVFLLIGLAVCVIIAPIFAYEYQTGADAVVLSSRFGRKRVIHAKILAGFLVSNGIFFFATAFFMIITFTAYGIQGWNASFQILSFTSFYNLTILQVFLCGLLLNYLIVMAVMSITMLLSSVCKTSFSAVIISTLWVFVPLFIPSSKSSKVFNYIINLLPAKALDTYTVFSVYDVYSFGQTVISLPIVILLFSAFIVLIALPLAHQSFRRHQAA